MFIQYDNGIPKYVQINKWLRGMIERGKIKDGEKIPTEVELAAKFGVNRMTVRKALDALVAEKMLVRRRGQGTFLISKKPRELIYQLKNITSFNDDMLVHDVKPAYQTLAMKVFDANDRVCEMLNLKNDRKVIFSLRILLANDDPVLIEKSHLPYSEFHEILGMDLNKTLYSLLTDRFNIHLHHATQTITSALSNEEETRLFKISSPTPCINMETIIYDDNNIPVEALFACYRGDKYKFKFSAREYVKPVSEQ